MTILREEEHKALKDVKLSGKVLDLGGDKRSDYQHLFKGTFTLTTVNFDAKSKPDIQVDLEEPLPIPDKAYDNVLLINVLEHIYHFKQLVTETARVLVPKGKIIIIVPYLFPYHPSPNDYHRFSKTALEKLLTESEFVNIHIQALGSGLRSAQILFGERLLPSSLQNFLAPLLHFDARGDDAALTWLAKKMKKKYDPSDYALGFFVTAEKHG